MAGRGGFFEANDTTLTCGWAGEGEPAFPITRAYIERVEFGREPHGAASTITVTAAFGRRPMTLQAARACVAAQVPTASQGLKRIITPPTKTYRLEFVLDGRDYRSAASSVAAARIFANP